MIDLPYLLTLSELDLFLALARHDKARVGNGYVWFDNGSTVLGVAHLDVLAAEHTWQRFDVEHTEKGTFVRTPSLDGRLGVYALLHFYERCGVDALFTTDEETQFSTARFFKVLPRYAWAFTFNRSSPTPWKPTCAVASDYDVEMISALTAFGYRVELDTYSDVVELRRKGLVGVNVGVGYRAQHTRWCSVYLDDYEKSVSSFEPFLEAHKQTCFDKVGGVQDGKEAADQHSVSSGEEG